MLKRSAIAGVLAAFGLVALATDAEAARVKSFFVANAENTISDDSYEVFLDEDGDGELEVGESIRGIIKFTSVKSGTFNQTFNSGASTTELTAIFQTLVIGRTDNLDGTFDFAFGPDPAFPEAVALGGGVAGKAMVLVYEDTSPDFTAANGPAAATDFTSASNGDLFWIMGFTSTTYVGAGGSMYTNAGEAWHAFDAPAVLPDPATSAVLIGSFAASLNRIPHASSIADSISLFPYISGLDGVSPIDFAADGNFSRSAAFLNGDDPVWPIEDFAQFRFRVIVPLPAAAWAGFAMLGLLGVGRKLRRRSA